MSRKLPVILTLQEQEILLKQPKPDKTKSGLKDFCLMLIMLNSGLRSAEVLALKTNDINWNSGELRVVAGKGEKDRIVWIDEYTLYVLKDWMKRRKNKTDLIFTTGNGQQIDTSYLRRMIKRYAKKAQITKDISPHTLRHTFASDLYRKTKNLIIVKESLGHSSISTTQVYTHLVNDELEQAMKKLREKGKEND